MGKDKKKGVFPEGITIWKLFLYMFVLAPLWHLWDVTGGKAWRWLKGIKNG